MPKLIYLGGGYHLSYRTDPHTEFQPSDSDARSHAEVSVPVGSVFVAEAPALFAWADGVPADEPPATVEPEAPKRRTRKAA